MKNHDSIPQVAILISTSSNWGRQIVEGILEYVNEVGPWHVWVNEGYPQMEDNLPVGWRGDGIIGQVVNPKLAQSIKEHGLPVVNVADYTLEGFPAPSVRTDDDIGTRMAAQHFIDRGFRNIAFVGPNHSPNPIWYEKSFKQSVTNEKVNYLNFTHLEESPEEHQRLKQWLLDLPKPVGVLVWSHRLSRTVVDYCMEEGIAVPHDIAVLAGGYDSLLCHACFPALSGVLGPTKQIGYRSAKLLHKMLQGEEVPNETIYLPPLGIKERLSTDTLAVDDPQLLQVVEYLKLHAFEPITMKDILKAVPMARRSLERRFQKVFGRSPIDEIRRLRIDKARKLLIETSLPMQEIAEACGYATYNYLTHVFKEETGITPRGYRKQYRQ